MTATNHVLTGALIGAVVHMPALALPIALASHFVCDSLPHFDYPGGSPIGLRYFSWLAADMGLAASILAALLLLQPAGFGLMVACGIVAASPDLMWLYYVIYRKGKNKAHWSRIAKFHGRIQKYEAIKYWPAELAWFLIAGWLLVINLHP